MDQGAWGNLGAAWLKSTRETTELSLLPASGAAAPSLGPDSPGDALYRFAAPELKAANHRLDGAFWPQTGEAGTPEQPVVLLEVQMHAKPGFKHRL